jgi:hypothetical protein
MRIRRAGGDLEILPSGQRVQPCASDDGEGKAVPIDRGGDERLFQRDPLAILFITIRGEAIEKKSMKRNVHSDF